MALLGAVAGCATSPATEQATPHVASDSDAQPATLFRESPAPTSVYRVFDRYDPRPAEQRPEPGQPGPAFDEIDDTPEGNRRLAAYFLQRAREDMLSLDFFAALNNYQRARQLDPDNLEAKLGENEAGRMLGTHDPILGHPDEE
jgi:hypothetical protein